MTLDIALLIPTYRRVDRLPELVANAVEQSPGAEVVLLMEPDEAIEVDGATTLTRTVGFGSYAAAINYGYWQTKQEWVFAGADDIVFRRQWLRKVGQKAGLHPEADVIGTNDLGNPYVIAGTHATHYAVRRRYLDEVGGVVDEGPGSFLWEGYDHNYTDTEFIETAKARGVFVPCLRAVVEHRHFVFGKAEKDETYEKSYAEIDADEKLYKQRVALWSDLT